MDINKLISAIALLLFMVSCSDKKSDIGNTPEQGNHLYYLSIGNAHYQKDVTGNEINDFINVKGANTSADYVAELLSCYGKGIKVNSDKDHLLTRETINKSLDAIINMAIKDSLSTTFIYYCGHGFADTEGNIYMVPGNHSFNEKSAATMESLVSINDIQNKLMEAVSKHYPNAEMTPEEKKEMSVIVIQMKKEHPDDNLDTGKVYGAVFNQMRKKTAKVNVPRFIILADCCTENFNVVNYDLLLKSNSSVTKSMEKAQRQMDSITKKMPAGAPDMSKMINIKQIGRTVAVGITKNGMWIGGNRTVYTGEIGKPAAMTPSPKDKDERVGPICRRLTLYLEKNDTFRIVDVLNSLRSKTFDSASTPAKFEVANTDWFDSSRMIQKYKATVEDNPYLDKRDSIPFICHAN